jgi:Acetyltransferase (GNAT) domain
MSNERELCVFNRKAFYELRHDDDSLYERIDWPVDGESLVSLAGSLRGSAFTSGANAPFGGPDFAPSVAHHTSQISEFVRYLIAQACDRGWESITIKAKPSCGSISEDLFQFELLNHGFRVVTADVNQYIDLTRFETSSEYVAALGANARKKLRRSNDGTLTFETCTTVGEWGIAYDILKSNRESRGRSLKLSLEYVLTMLDVFPDMASMHLVRSDGSPCAAALVYRIGFGRQLVVYWGDANHELRTSPMHLLASELVAQALKEGASLIDLGISSENGSANHGLVEFKQLVGATMCPRYEFEWHPSNDN